MSLAGSRRWTPEEAARFEIELCRGLANDKKAQRVYFAKLRVVQAARCGRGAGPDQGSAPQDNVGAAEAAGADDSGPTRRQSGAAAETRKRRRKTPAQQAKNKEKLQARWLRRRCEAAANKEGGSPPRVLARVLACCGRFIELLLPEGAERMRRLRESAAQERTVKQDAVDGGLRAMQLAMKHVSDQAGSMDVEPTSPPPGWRGMSKSSGPRRFIPSQQPKRHPGGVDSRERDDSRTGVKTPKTN